jgi:hypothetical protein
MLAKRDHIEMAVKSSHAKDFTGGNIQAVGNIRHSLLIHIPE